MMQTEIEKVRDTAEAVLRGKEATGTIDNALWDRTQRLLRNVEWIAALPEIKAANASVDHFCLKAATYFCESGLSRFEGLEDRMRPPVTSDRGRIELLDFSTQIVEEQLEGIVSPVKVHKINQIISESFDRSTRLHEAMILSDARNLDDMGAVGIFNDFRRSLVQGKGVTDVLQAWKRRIDYRYWEARLKESFRFETVRKIAERRFTSAEHFMAQLSVENLAKDLQEMTIEEVDESLKS